MSSDAIVLSEVTKSFGPQRAVDALSLRVPRGTVFGFIGPNGSGKTTTLRMIMSILLPDSGSVTVLGDGSPTAARDRVGYLPEERGLYRKMTVRRLLRYYGRLKGKPAAELERSIDRWLERLAVRDWADRKIEALSKGMAQKVQLLTVLVTSPELLVLDEPFSGLDPVNVEALKEALLEARAAGATILFSTHDMAMAEKLCDQLAMIFQGRKVLDGTLAQIQQSHGRKLVRVQTRGGRADLEGLAGLSNVRDQGRLVELELDGDPQELLAELVRKTEVTHFELARSSLHDVFLRMARPEAAAERDLPEGGHE